jgi:hypothetical protein
MLRAKTNLNGILSKLQPNIVSYNKAMHKLSKRYPHRAVNLFNVALKSPDPNLKPTEKTYLLYLKCLAISKWEPSWDDVHNQLINMKQKGMTIEPIFLYRLLKVI